MQIKQYEKLNHNERVSFILSLCDQRQKNKEARKEVLKLLNKEV